MSDIPVSVWVVGGALLALYLWSTLRRQATRRRLGAVLAQGATVVDVRTPEEYKRGHYQGAVNIPVDSLEKKLKGLPKDGNIVVYCASGARSARAAGLLKAAGFAKVVNAGTQGALP